MAEKQATPLGREWKLENSKVEASKAGAPHVVPTLLI
jgi:hypothetical protein